MNRKDDLEPFIELYSKWVLKQAFRSGSTEFQRNDFYKNTILRGAINRLVVRGLIYESPDHGEDVYFITDKGRAEVIAENI